MIEVIPAVMPYDLDDLQEKMRKFVDHVPFVQIDIMDGIFAESKSWPYTDGGPQEFAVYSSEQEGFPFWNKLDFSVDMMVSDPESVIDDWVRAGATRAIIHIESVQDLDGLIERVRERLVDESGFGIAGIEVGLAIQTTTSPEVLDPYIDNVNFIQCMGIERIGFQGEPFDERVLDQIRYFKTRAEKTKISVDGGVNFETAPALIEAGADVLLAGSLLRDSDDILGDIERLKNS